jgi:hypothetical protein
VDTLKLTVNPSYHINVYGTAMRYHEYSFGDFTVTPVDTGTYTYDFQYYTAEGCDSVVHLILYVANNDGIVSHDVAVAEIFPNPTNTVLHIKGEGIRQIEIYNAEGQLVYVTEEMPSDLKTIDVSRYAAGQYLVKILFNNKQTVTKKVIVNHQ